MATERPPASVFESYAPPIGFQPQRAPRSILALCDSTGFSLRKFSFECFYHFNNFGHGLHGPSARRLFGMPNRQSAWQFRQFLSAISGAGIEPSWRPCADSPIRHEPDADLQRYWQPGLSGEPIQQQPQPEAIASRAANRVSKVCRRNHWTDSSHLWRQSLSECSLYVRSRQ